MSDHIKPVSNPDLFYKISFWIAQQECNGCGIVVKALGVWIESHTEHLTSGFSSGTVTYSSTVVVSSKLILTGKYI